MVRRRRILGQERLTAMRRVNMKRWFLTTNKVKRQKGLSKKKSMQSDIKSSTAHKC